MHRARPNARCSIDGVYTSRPDREHIGRSKIDRTGHHQWRGFTRRSPVQPVEFNTRVAADDRRHRMVMRWLLDARRRMHKRDGQRVIFEHVLRRARDRRTVGWRRVRFGERRSLGDECFHGTSYVRYRIVLDNSSAARGDK